MKENKTQTLVLDPQAQTTGDFKNSILVVSVFANLFVLTSWLVLQVS